jgi:hypothetical protein
VFGPGRPVIQPTGRAPDVLTLDLFFHRRVIDPAIAVTDHLMAAVHASLGELRILLERAGDAEDAHLDGEIIEHVEHAPGAAPAAVFEHGFHERRADAALCWHADVVEHALGYFVAVEQR